MLNFVFWIIELKCEYTKANTRKRSLSVFAFQWNYSKYKVQHKSMIRYIFYTLSLLGISWFVFVTLTKYKMWILLLLCWVLDSVDIFKDTKSSTSRKTMGNLKFKQQNFGHNFIDLMRFNTLFKNQLLKSLSETL